MSRRALWMIGLGCLLMAAIFVYLGYHFGWKWTGFPKQRLFDWIKILVIPVAVAIGTFVLNRAARDAMMKLNKSKESSKKTSKLSAQKKPPYKRTSITYRRC
jgi:hypothetical protein